MKKKGHKLMVALVKAKWIIWLPTVLVLWASVAAMGADVTICSQKPDIQSGNFADGVMKMRLKNVCQFTAAKFDTLVGWIRMGSDDIFFSAAGMVLLIGGLYVFVNQATKEQTNGDGPTKEKNMFCPRCRCEYVKWIKKCPGCDTALNNELPPQPEAVSNDISYEGLVSLVKEKGGKLKIDMLTTDVGREKKWSFPYQGYGFGWAQIMQGAYNDTPVYLLTTEVGKETKWTFPYQGYGFAWARQMRGNIGGNEVTLTTTKVGMEKKWSFPYQGYGFGWAEKMSGLCGDQLKAKLITTEVGRDQSWSFPYQGYGFGWANKAVLTLTLKTDN